MSTKAVVDGFWQAMQDNDWTRAASLFVSDCVIDWPCSGERIVGGDDYAAVQATYPTRTGRWSFDIHRVVVDDASAVSEVTVTDGEQSARVVSFFTVENEGITALTEYWPAPYDPPTGRETLMQRGDRIP